MLIVQLLSGITLIARHNVKSLHKVQIITVMSFWALSMIYYQIYNISVMLVEGTTPSFSFNHGVCNMDLILSALPCFFAIVGYPFAALYPRILHVRTLLLVISPMLLLVAAYFLWHFVSGVDPFYVYSDIATLWANIATVPVILRLLVLAFFVGYVVFSLINAWRIIPIYSKLSKKYYSQSSYDISWIRTLIIYYALVSACIVTKIFVNSIYLNTLFLVLCLILFFYLIEKSLFSRDFEDVNKLGIKWTINEGWHTSGHGSHAEKHHTVDVDDMSNKIDKWMREERPYAKIHFTSDDILDRFAQLNNDDLRKVFKSRGTSLHAYIREYRIKEACHIIETNRGNTNLKEVYSSIGFSHYSSFSRAFIQLVGESPTDYIQQQKQKATRL